MFRSLRIGVLALCVALLVMWGGVARADVLIKDAVFTRSNVSAAPAPGSVADGWTDLWGRTWGIASSALTAADNTYTAEWLMRPMQESCRHQKMVIKWTAPTSGNAGGFMLGMDPWGRNAVVFWYSGTTAYIQYSSRSSFTANVSTTMTAAINNGHNYTTTITRDPNATSGCDFTETVQDTTTPATILSSWTVSGSPIAGSYCGSGGFGLTPFSTTQTVAEVLCYNTDTSASVTAGYVGISAQTATQVSLGVGPPSGGTGPFTAHLYRSSSPNATPGAGTDTGISASQAAGATITLTDTPPASGPYYYRVLWTDTAGTLTSATSNDCVASLGGAGNGISVLFVGDSTTANAQFGSGTAEGGDAIGFPTYNLPIASTVAGPEYCAMYLKSFYNVNRAVSIFNAGYSGTTSGQWAATGSTYLANAATGGTSIGATIAYIRLGANDAKAGAVQVSQATYQSNLSTIVTNLKASCPTITKAILASPYYINISHPGFAYSWNGTWDSTSQTAIVGYQTAIANLAGTTISGVSILSEDANAYAQYSQHPEWSYDGVHPNGLGMNQVGFIMAQNLARLNGFGFPVPNVRRRIQ